MANEENTDQDVLGRSSVAIHQGQVDWLEASRGIDMSTLSPAEVISLAYASRVAWRKTEEYQAAKAAQADIRQAEKAKADEARAAKAQERAEAKAAKEAERAKAKAEAEEARAAKAAQKGEGATKATKATAKKATAKKTTQASQEESDPFGG